MFVGWCAILISFYPIRGADQSANPGTLVLDPDEYDDPVANVDKFWKDPAELSPNPDVAEPPLIKLVGNGVSEVKTLVMDWINQYRIYRTGYAVVDNGPAAYIGNLTVKHPMTLNKTLEPGFLTDASVALDGKHPDGTPITEEAARSFGGGSYLNYLISPMKKIRAVSDVSDNLMYLPLMAGGLFIGYNFPEKPEGTVLKLNQAQIYKIFTGEWKYIAWESGYNPEDLLMSSRPLNRMQLQENNDWWDDYVTAGTGPRDQFGQRKFYGFTLPVPLTIFVQKNSIAGFVMLQFLNSYRALHKLPAEESHGTVFCKRPDDVTTPSIDYFLQSADGLALTTTTQSSANCTNVRPPAGSPIETWITRILPSQLREATLPVRVCGGMLATPLSICVAQYVEAQPSAIQIAPLENTAGNYVTPSLLTFQWTMESFSTNTTDDDSNFRGDYTNVPGNLSYPLMHMYYIYIKKSGLFMNQPLDCDRTVQTLRFLRFVYAQFESRRGAANIPTAFITSAAYAKVRSKLKRIRCGEKNESAWILLKKEIEKDMNTPVASIVNDLVSFLLAIPSGILLIYLGWRFSRFVRVLQKVRDAVYKVPSAAIFLATKQYALTDRFKGVVASRRVVDYHTPKAYVHTMYFGRWKAYQVMLRPCSLNIHRMSQTMKRALVDMIEMSTHERVATFYGLTEVKNGRYFVSNFCPYGDLRSIIIAKEYTFSLNMKFSLAGDIAVGMAFLHKRGTLHGNLRSCAIYIEADFSAKVGDWEYNTLHRLQGTYFPQETRLAQTLTLFEQTAFYPWLYWTAPEVLQSGMLGTAIVPIKAQDVYSFGIILGEIFGEEAAFQRYQDSPYNFTPTEIITKILSGNLRPRLVSGNDAPASVSRLMNHCWAFAQSDRPTFETVRSVLRLVVSPRKPISDLVVIESQILADKLKKKGKRMERRYEVVAKKFHKYSRALVPFPIWRRIYIGHMRPPLNRHEDAVVLRCTLCNYDSILSAEDPQTAMDTLNLMHRVFDELLERNGRIYRLFRDGATVVAVGGAPFGLELDPVHSVAQTALDYLVWAYNSRAPSQPALQIRFGIHSGAVAAGCVDYSAAHYVLLGELMKIVFHIEAASRPYRILISEDFNDKLRQLAKVYVKYRVVEAAQTIRSYDKKAYWLIGSNIYDQQYLLDDILYGKDELDQTSDSHIGYGQETGIITDCHTAQIVAVDGKNPNGSGNPSLKDSAAIVRSLKKKKAGIMKVPPPHVLKAQIMEVVDKRRLRTKEHGHFAYEVDKEHKTNEEEAIDGGPALPADILVGIHHRTRLDDELEQRAGTTQHPVSHMTAADIIADHMEDKRSAREATVGKKLQQVTSAYSGLSSIRTTDEYSIASGEGRKRVGMTLNVVQTPAYDGIFGIDESRRGISRLENIPPRPYTFKVEERPRIRSLLEVNDDVGEEVSPRELTVDVAQDERVEPTLEGSEVEIIEVEYEDSVTQPTAMRTVEVREGDSISPMEPAFEDAEDVAAVRPEAGWSERSLTEAQIHSIANKSSDAISVYADLPTISSEMGTHTILIPHTFRLGIGESRHVDPHSLDQSDIDIPDNSPDDALPFTEGEEIRANDIEGLTNLRSISEEEPMNSISHQNLTGGGASRPKPSTNSSRLQVPTADRSGLEPSHSAHHDQHDKRGHHGAP